MQDIQCILDMSLVSEKEQLKEDIFKGKGLQVLIILLNCDKTAGDIARTLKIPICSALLYLNRFINANIVAESQSFTKNGTLEKIYKLCSTNLEIINKHKDNLGQSESKKLECEIMSSHFSKLAGNSIKELYRYQDKPYLVKSSFIKANKEQMIEFREELNKLFEKYNLLEDTEAEDTYAFICSYTPYNVENV